MTLPALLETYPVLLGLGLGALVILIVTLVLPRHERKLARGPIILLIVYGLARYSMSYFAATAFPARVLHFIAVFAWCTSLVRIGFVLFTSSRIARFAGRPWPKIMRDVVQVFLYFGVALIALRAIGVEPGSLLTTSALLTAVLGLSMQETLGNLFAGLAIQSQQSLTVGDWVRWADGPEGFGEVIEVNWRATHLLTNNRVQVIVPNGVIARSIVKNYSRPTRIVRIDIDILLPYGISPEHGRHLLVEAVRDIDGVLAEPEPHVLLGNFTDAGVTYSVRVFIDDYGRRDPIESAVRQRILYAMRRGNVEIPFPHRALIHTSAVALPREFLSEFPPSQPTTNGSTARTLSGRLSHFDLFRGFDPSALKVLAEGVHSALYAPGEAIIRQGESGSELFALERGRVEVLVSPEGRSPVRVRVLEAGAIFGEAALLTGESRSATIVALTECEVITIPRGAFQHLVESSPHLAERLTGLLAKRMDELSQAVTDASQPEHADGDRRSDILIQRIRQFFGR